MADTATANVTPEPDSLMGSAVAKKFPGYTSANLSEKGVPEVSQRRFVLVAADHPIVSAISENADKLQMGEISMMCAAAAPAPPPSPPVPLSSSQTPQV